MKKCKLLDGLVLHNIFYCDILINVRGEFQINIEEFFFIRRESTSV